MAMSDHSVLAVLFQRHHDSLEQRLGEVIEAKLQPIRHQLAGLDVIQKQLVDLGKQVADIIASLEEPPHPTGGKIVLLQPTFTDLKTGAPIMAAYPLKTNVVAHFVITETDPATSALVPVDPADTFTVVSSDPVNLNAIVDKNAAGQTTVSVNWLHTTSPMLTGVGIAITDSQGNTADNAETFDMVPPAHVAAQIGLDVAGVTETPQPTAV